MTEKLRSERDTLTPLERYDKFARAHGLPLAVLSEPGASVTNHDLRAAITNVIVEDPALAYDLSCYLAWRETLRQMAAVETMKRLGETNTEV